MNKQEAEMKKIEEVENKIADLRKDLDEIDLLMKYPDDPDGLPKSIYLTGNNKEIHLSTHNILGWILGIVLEKKTKVRKKLNAQ